MLWHDQRYVWFVPKVAPSKHWVAKILVEVLVAHDLADIGKKNELELARVHWHPKKMATIHFWVTTKTSKKMATIQTKTNLWVKLVVEDLVLNVISAYAPQVGHNENTKREF